MADANATIDGRRLEEAGLNMLQTPRQLFYDGWLVRLLPGRARRTRSVSALFGSTLPLPDKIAHCERLYAHHGLPVLFRMTPYDYPPDLDAALAARGYDTFDRTLVQVAALPAAPGFDTPPEVEIAVEEAEAFAGAMAAVRGMDPPPGRHDPPPDPPLPTRRLAVRRAGRPVAVGQATLDGRLAGVGNVATAADLRGQGLATAVVGALLAWAWERGAAHAFLQVDAENHRAHAVYRRYGFATAHAYHYRGRPGEVS
jgi:GNAT superfamily N-acetyltransferase